MHRQVFLIDTDTASDDAVALIMAFNARDVRVAAVTVVAGNLGVEQACRNALYTAELCKADVPVYQGAGAPLTRRLYDATWFHGRDGLGDRGYPAPQRAVEEQPAVDAIIQAVDTNPGIVLVTLGPLTNIALALQRKPEIARNVSRCVLMGGNPCCEGNVTPAAEFNIWVDPEAARIVLRSDLPIELIGWQLSRGHAVLNERDIEHVLAFDNPVARFAIQCNERASAAYQEQTGEIGISLPDPIAMAVALDPGVGTEWSRHYVDVEIESELTRGMTVVDRLNVAGNPRNSGIWAEFLKRAAGTNVCWKIDAARWKNSLFAALR